MSLNYFFYKLLKPFKSWKNKIYKNIANNEARRSRLFDNTLQEISEYTKEPVEVIRIKHKQGPEKECDYSIFQEQGSLSREKVEKFYAQCNYYLYELPLWNAERNRPKYLCSIILPYLKKNQYQKILDFGGGAGDLCIELAKNGLNISYCDIGEILYNFAQWRFKKRNLAIRMVKGMGAIEGFYDCIVSFDAFEHVKDLEQIIKKLSSHIKHKGSLIFSGAFSGGTLHLEENEQYNDFKKLDLLMKACGLSFQDKFAQFYFYKKN